MSESMIHRLAKLIEDHASTNAGDAGEGDIQRLLQAMIEPTDDMVEAGAQIVPGADPAMHSEVAKDVWRAMVRAALVS